MIFQNAVQATSALTHLADLRKRRHDRPTLPDPNVNPQGRPSPLPPTAPDPNALSRPHCIALLHFLHLLRTQRTTPQPETNPGKRNLDLILPTHLNTYTRSLATSLRRNDYVSFNKLTSPTHPILSPLASSEELHAKAVLIAVAYLRDHVRTRIWACVHSAYREFVDEAWLARSLCLDKSAPWIEERVKAGEAAPKPNSAKGWLVVRAKPPVLV